MLSLFKIDRRSEKSRILRNSRDTVHFLSEAIGERTIRNYSGLNRARNYILESFRSNGADPIEQTYTAEGRQVANIIAEIRGEEAPLEYIVIGAHYDTVEGSPGADDNATAVAALLELHRLFSSTPCRCSVRFVAFTLEEPPFFSGDLMGSVRYAKACHDSGDEIRLMICLEMLGYASRKHAQDFPHDEMRKRYPCNGDFLAVVSLPSMSEYVYKWKALYNSHAKRSIHELIGPASIPGMALSDHMSFIKNGYPAIMITDTGFYRNKFYHTENDTFDTINFKFLTETIYNSYLTIQDLLDREVCPGKD